MASSFFCNNTNSLPLATLLEWYKIRDMFCGNNFVQQNIPLALEMAASCTHPDAVWLTEACAGKNVKSAGEAERVFSSLDQNDARVLCFMWCCGDNDDESDLPPLRRSAELGFAFAQATLVGEVEGSEKFKFAQLSAAQGERDGLTLLGCCVCDGFGCEKNLDKSKEILLLAIKLGDVFAMIELGYVLENSDPRRWRWWGQAAALGNSWTFLSTFIAHVELLNSHSVSAAVVFAIGQSLHGHVNEEARRIFNSSALFKTRIGPAKQAIAFYEAQLNACRKAVDEWTKVAIRFGIYKDMRILVAQYIWSTRDEALYLN